jgi:hypothetical protein
MDDQNKENTQEEQKDINAVILPPLPNETGTIFFLI